MEKERPPVFGMMQRGGQVVLNLLANVQQKTIEPFIKDTIVAGTRVYTDEALVGFQGRGSADGVQPNCCHPFLLEALLFQWPSIRRCASRTMVEHKTPESNKSVLAISCPEKAGGTPANCKTKMCVSKPPS